MKTILSFSFLMLFSVATFAQRATVIDPSFMTVPRYADLTAINTAIASPQQGMLVYNIATQSYWFRNSSAWTNLAAAVSGSQWTNFGNDITNNNSGGVSIGNVLGSGGSKFLVNNSTHGTAINAFQYNNNPTLTIFNNYDQGPALLGANAIYGNSRIGIGVVGATTNGYGGYFISGTSTSSKALVADGPVDLNGFTKLGNDAATPKIKMKKLTGTTPTSANPNSFTYLPHGVTGSKILSISVIVSDGGYQYLPHSPNIGAIYTVDVNPIQSAIAIGVKDATSSANVMGQPIKVLITYEE